MGLEYSRTQFGETYSTAYLEISEYLIRVDDNTGYFEFKVYDTDSKTHLLKTERVDITWDTITTSNTAEDQAYEYITGSMTEYSSAT